MRTTIRGLTQGALVYVRGNDVQRAFCGTYVRPNDAGTLHEIRSDRNGGVYLVRIERIRQRRKVQTFRAARRAALRTVRA